MYKLTEEFKQNHKDRCTNTILNSKREWKLNHLKKSSALFVVGVTSRAERKPVQSGTVYRYKIWWRNAVPAGRSAVRRLFAALTFAQKQLQAKTVNRAELYHISLVSLWFLVSHHRYVL